MSDLSPVRKNVQVEESRFRSAVSEAVVQKVGSAINFINDFQKFDKQFFLNGAYYTLPTPFLGVDGLTYIPNNARITDVFMFARKAGSGGSTTLDLKFTATPGGTFTSIFSTQPRISYAAGDFSFCYTGSSFSNTTAPVLSTNLLAAGSVVRMDLMGSQTGAPAGCGIVLFMQPSN